MSTMTTIITKELEEYLESLSENKKDHLNEIFESGSLFNKKEMQISWLQASLYKLLITLTHSERILEIGTFVGFSAAVAAEAIPKNGEVTTIEIIEDYYKKSIENFNKFSINNINPKLGDAKEIILRDEIKEEKYDLIFLDGNKENYPFYFHNLKDNLRKGGLFLVDNILFKGEVINSNKSNHAKGISELNELFSASDEFIISHITIGDGLMIAIKK